MHNLKKVFFAFLIFLNFSLFAYTGNLSGEKNLRVLKTQWFDIIYPERCEKTAAILYNRADTIYYEVTEQYGISPNARIPIVVTPAVESLNAFWSVVPYSHIVLYDTSYDSLNELSVFSENLLSIFRHELTHAVTYTMKNGFWSTVTNIFGDAVNIGPLLVTSGMAEGATVTSESAVGEGRLNDEYAKHPVKQAKIEDKFPVYYGVQGAGDLNPYYFNGAFHQWLQNKYGMEAYAKFWYYTINVQGLTVRWRFKKAFGTKLDKAWKEFIQDYEVPAVAANPVEAGQSVDLFLPDSEKYSRANNAGSLYTSLVSTNESLYWLDSSSRGIFTAAKNQSGTEKLKYKKILTQAGAYSLGVSKDSKIMAISCYTDSKAAISAKVKLYNLENKQLYTVNVSGLKDAAVIEKDGEYYLVAGKFVTPDNSIQIYKILFSHNKITGVEKVSEQILPLNVFTASYTSLNGQFAYIKKDGMAYSICISDLDGTVTAEYSVPENKMVIHSLSSEDNKLFFSWAKTGTMPRYGSLDLDSKQMTLSEQDISGGVYSPVADGNSIVYIGKFLNQNRLLSVSAVGDASYVTTTQIEAKTEVSGAAEEQTESSDYEIPESQKYNIFSPFYRGMFLPVSIYSSEFFGFNYGKNPNMDINFGATYFTAAPWSSGLSDSIILTGGWNPIYKNAGFELISQFGTDTSLLSSKTDIKTEFDSKGWQMSSGKITLASGFHFGTISTFQIQNLLEVKAGRQKKWVKSTSLLDLGHFEDAGDTIYYDIYETLALAYSNVHYSGPGNYEKLGLSTTAGVYYLQDGAFSYSNPLIKLYDFYVNASGYIPRLLPFESTYGFTTNLPSTIGFKILPPSASEVTILDISANTILFDMLIKNPLPLFNGIYLQNWTVRFGYNGAFYPLSEKIYKGTQFVHVFDYATQVTQGQFKYYDSINLQIDLTVSPNMGVFSRNDYRASVYAAFIYNMTKKQTTPQFQFNCGINLAM